MNPTREELRLTARQMHADGHTVAEIIGALGVTQSTVYRWIAKETSEKIILDRNGEPPLEFCGRLLSTADGMTWNCKPAKPGEIGTTNPHFYVVSVWEAERAPARYVVGIVYRKHYRGQEIEIPHAYLTDDPGYTCGQYDPIADIVGYPADPTFDAQQAKLEGDCQKQYRWVVSQALRPLPTLISDAPVLSRDGELCDIFSMLCHHLRGAWTFTPEEAAAIVDAGQSLYLLSDSFLGLPSNLAHVLQNNNLCRKWGADERELLSKLHALSPADRAALAVSIRVFYEHTDKPLGQRLTLAGLQ